MSFAQFSYTIIFNRRKHNGFRKKLKRDLNREIDFTNIEMREFYKSWNCGIIEVLMIMILSNFVMNTI